MKILTTQNPYYDSLGFVWIKAENWYCRIYRYPSVYGGYPSEITFFETEEAINRDVNTRMKQWREPTPEEIDAIEKDLETITAPDLVFEKKINDKKQSQYTDVLNSLTHNCVRVLEINYREQTLIVQCMNCGEKRKVSFFEMEKLTQCPHCRAEVGEKFWGVGLNVIGGDVFGDRKIQVRDMKQTKTIFTKVQPKKKKEFVFYMDDNEEKLTILCVTNSMEVKGDKISSRYILNWEASYSWREGSKATKLYGKNSTKDCDFIDLILEVSSLGNDNSLRTDHVHWVGSKNATSFLIDHQKFFHKIGFFDFMDNSREDLTYCENRVRIECVMLKYISLLGQYPTFEQIVKAGHGVLAANVIRNITYIRKADIRDAVKELEEELNLDTPSGIKALKLPKYVAKYLKEQKAGVEEYKFWIQHWAELNFSKENFEKFVGDAAFRFLKMENHFDASFVELVGRGYDPQKLKTYIVKQKLQGLTLLKDYLDMCEEAGIEPDPYPYHLQKMHDDVVDICKNVKYDPEYVRSRQGTARDVVTLARELLESKKRFPANFKDYIVLFPTEKQEFFNEGNAMHSCVGPYMRNVNKGENIVYYIRKADDPATSYVTAEWSKAKEGHGQILMSNNRECSDENAYAFATWVADTIQLGIDRGMVV